MYLSVVGVFLWSLWVLLGTESHHLQVKKCSFLNLNFKLLLELLTWIYNIYINPTSPSTPSCSSCAPSYFLSYSCLFFNFCCHIYAYVYTCIWTYKHTQAYDPVLTKTCYTFWNFFILKELHIISNIFMLLFKYSINNFFQLTTYLSIF